jgi:hypothetical protein
MKLELVKGRVQVDPTLMVEIDGSRFVEEKEKGTKARAEKEERNELLKRLLSENAGIVGSSFCDLAKSHGLTEYRARKFLEEGIKSGSVDLWREGQPWHYRLMDL